ncbi:MAG: PLP-dependent aminotransferase family protein [Coriobacteriales bacterium]|jgi:2-aminoadipate transaminase
MTRMVFDEWTDKYAERMHSIRRSAVRDLFAAASRSDVISLSGGMPEISVLPLDAVAQAVKSAIDEEGVKALQYGSSIGRVETREVVCGLMEDLDIHVVPDDIIITSGAQQALDLIGKTFIDPGDPIILEAPTYVGTLQAFSQYQPDIHGIELDSEGMRIDLLEAELEKLGDRKPKFIYTIPNFHNPAGVTMSLERRKRLLEVAHKHGILVIEDDPYGRLRYSGEPIASLRSMDGNVVYLGTVSKMFAPGVRTGWIIAPKPILAKINLTKQAADLCGSTLDQVVVEHYFNDTPWRETLEALRKQYAERRDAMLAALEEFFPPEAEWTHPDGGFFLWVTLPRFVDTDQMLSLALEQGVTYVPGKGCDAAGGCTSSMRLAFCYETPENIHEAIRRLALVIEERMELYRAFIKAGAIEE